MTIAALARAAREPSGGDLDTSQYADAARRGYLHLREHNLAYLDDGVENIIDDYCALLAAVELTRTLGAEWLAEARDRAGGCAPASAPTPIRPPLGRQRRWLSPLLPRRRGGPAGAGAAGVSRHRAGSGAPVGGPDRRRAGPGGRAGPRGPGRQSLRPRPPVCERVDEAPLGELFHAPPQRIRLLVAGENARLASLATMAFAATQHLPGQSALLCTFGQQQLDWILGRNPSTPACWRVRASTTRNTPPATPMRRGSATASPQASDDENDVAFIPEAYKDRLDQNWRWGAMDPARRLVRPGHHLAERTRRPP